MRKIIVLAALKSEFVTEDDFSLEIKYTGIGKINSARATTQLILQEKPDLVINVGTAGAQNLCLESILLMR
jgi:adenosylhomocysteine nucleosidase